MQRQVASPEMLTIVWYQVYMISNRDTICQEMSQPACRLVCCQWHPLCSNFVTGAVGRVLLDICAVKARAGVAVGDRKLALHCPLLPPSAPHLSACLRTFDHTA